MSPVCLDLAVLGVRPHNGLTFVLETDDDHRRSAL
jgi:hypothetical protein